LPLDDQILIAPCQMHSSTREPLEAKVSTVVFQG
jgi:hypothetical protein